MERVSGRSPAYDQLLEEEYIDMDVSSAFFSDATSSPPHSREFAFFMSSNPLEREPITSPADELFYKGKLLPLHLPPRLQMVERLIDKPITTSHWNATEGGVTAASHTSCSTPFESCNISPASSCYVSGELNLEEHECSAGFDQALPKKSWSKKLKLIRQSSLGLKLKASRDYLKSLFTRSAGADDPPRAVRRTRELPSNSPKVGKKNPFGLIRWERYQVVGTAAKSTDREKKMEEECAHRRSFSGVIQHHLVNNSSSVSSSSSSSSSTSSCSSSSSSSSSISSGNSSGHHGSAMLKRSSSVNSEVECSIQGAIAYCKKSQQSAGARKSFSDVGCCTLSPSKVAADCET